MLPQYPRACCCPCYCSANPLSTDTEILYQRLLGQETYAVKEWFEDYCQVCLSVSYVSVLYVSMGVRAGAHVHMYMFACI